MYEVRCQRVTTKRMAQPAQDRHTVKTLRHAREVLAYLNAGDCGPDRVVIGAGDIRRVSPPFRIERVDVAHASCQPNEYAGIRGCLGPCLPAMKRALLLIGLAPPSFSWHEDKLRRIENHPQYLLKGPLERC
jgi:hypothetical protein